MMENFKFVSKEDLNKIPKEPGVYCLSNEKEIFYIGKAANLRERVKNHFQQPSYKDYLFLDKVEKIGYIKTGSEIEALILEANLIKKYQPKFNVIWRDDKNYFFVGITKEDFPRIFITHQPQKLINSSTHQLTTFVGPFVDGKALKQTLKILRKIFPFRSCKKLPKRPCLFYHLGYCLGPCLLKSKFFEEIKDQSQIKKISQKNAQMIMKILKEGKKSVLKELKKEMKKEAKLENFEEAKRLRDQVFALEKTLSHSKIFEEILIESPEWEEIERKLKEILNFERKIERIEAFDVSNIGGKFATGSMITFLKGIPEKNLYRRFKIKFEKKPNDIGMLKEILKRRFSHLEWGLPDLILIDGGKAQLNAAIKAKIPEFKGKIIALSKKENKLFLEDKKEPLFLKNLPKEVSSLILKINKESHRFAISYHQNLRKKALFDIKK